jgi:putative flippase GtrA
MTNLKRHFLNSVFYKFLLVSGFAALINFFSRILLSLFMSYSNAIVFAYLLGMLTAFSLNRMLVFKSASQGKISHQFYWFTLINVFAIIQTLLVSLWLADYVLPNISMVSSHQEIAHFIGICVPVFSSFLGHKYITFKK